MTSIIEQQALAPAGEATKLPALGSPQLSPEFLARVKEILEVLLGRRGGAQWDRAVTFRDLYALNLAPGAFGTPDGADVREPGVVGNGQRTITQLERDLRETEAYKALVRRIGSAEDLEMFPDEIRSQLSRALAEVARERQAAIEQVERKIHTTALSMASRLVEITAAIEDSAAGVRHLDAAYADKTRALATSVSQISAQLGNVGGVTLEERFLAIADAIDGLLGQWSIKIQTNPANGEPPVIAGISLSVEDPIAGPGTSALVFLAEKFGFFTNNGAVMPFGIDANGNVYINGTLRINDGGGTLQDIASTPGVQGPQGVPGPTGPAGQSYYTWIKYADNPAGTGLYDTPTDSTTHIGIAVNRTTPTESDTPGDYVWSKFRGDVGVQGPIGPNGAPTYTWIKYATSSAGANLSDDPAGKAYIGFAYNKSTAAESTDPALYTWSLIQGPQGPQGVPGPTGPEGQQLYTWIKYADSADGAGLYDSPTAATTHIGIAVNKNSPNESSTPSDYVWSAFRGAPGVPGPQGYTWIKYATSSAGANLSDDPTGRTYIGFAYNKTTATESTAPGDYTWSLMQGPQGAQGNQGPQGPQGPAGSSGSNGQRGNMDVVLNGSGWPSDGTASSNFASATGYWPINRDRLTYATGNSNTETKFYNNGSWLPISAWINGNMVVTGTFSASKISADTMTGQTYQTSWGGTRTVINESGNNLIKCYSGSSESVSIGGSLSGVAYIRNLGGAVPAVYASNTSSSSIVSAVFGSTSGPGPGVDGYSSSGPGLRAQSGSGDAITITGGTYGIRQTGGGINWLNTINPNADGGASLGTSGGFRWSALYANSSTITTSDARTKTAIEASDLGLDFINALNPVKYKQIVAENIATDNWVEVEPEVSFVDDFGNLVVVSKAVMENQRVITPRAGVRYHYGLLAQEVKAALDAAGVADTGIWSLGDPSDPDSRQALRYEELVAPAIRAIQQLNDKVDVQAAQIATMQAQIAMLIERLPPE